MPPLRRVLQAFFCRLYLWTPRAGSGFRHLQVCRKNDMFSGRAWWGVDRAPWGLKGARDWAWLGRKVVRLGS